MIKRQCSYPLGQQAKSPGHLPGTKFLGTSDERGLLLFIWRGLLGPHLRQISMGSHVRRSFHGTHLSRIPRLLT